MTCKIQTKLQHSFSEMFLKLFFHSVIFLLFFQAGSLFKGKESVSFVLTSVCTHLLVPSNPNGLNKKEYPVSSSVLSRIGSAHSVKITNVNTGSGSIPDFFGGGYFRPLFSCILFFLDPQVCKYGGIVVCFVCFGFF